MELKDWGEWSEWEPLLKVDLSKISNGPGAYMIAAKSTINRAIGKDEEGILDVGESNTLRDRIKSFIGCAKGNRKSGHMAGWRYREFNFNDVFPLESLYLAWYVAKTKNEAYQLEANILKSYIKQHHELPPLNYKYNWAE